MREIKASSEPFEDELDSSDPADYLSFPLAFYADATLRVNGAGPLKIGLLDSSRQDVLSFSYRGGGPEASAIRRIKGLMPGKYFAVIEPAHPLGDGEEVAYGISINGVPAADTGCRAKG